MFLYYTVCYGQPQPGSAILSRAGLVNPVKPLEYPAKMLSRHSLACVGNDDFNRTASGVQLQLDLIAGSCVLYGVVDQNVNKKRSLKY
jgi:hypothetical protein